MTGHVARRTPRTRRRAPDHKRLLRPLLGAALVVAGVLVSVEPADLPGPLESLAPDAPALAQENEAPAVDPESEAPAVDPQSEAPAVDPESEAPAVDPQSEAPAGAVVFGKTNDCGPLRKERGSECVLETAACPKSILDEMVQSKTVQSKSSPEFPGFCEESVLDSDDDVAYNTCISSAGVVVVEYEVVPEGAGGDGGGEDGAGGGDGEEGDDGREQSEDVQVDKGCRLIYPAKCAVGIRVSVDTCRAVERRTWSCLDGQVPRNEFNTCYVLPTEEDHAGHPACEEGSPHFVAQSCADYVGGDFMREPGNVDCQSYPDADSDIRMWPNPRSGDSAGYWCAFDTSLLRVDCHRSNPTADCPPIQQTVSPCLNPPVDDCPATMAWCLKRASNTGGCSAITNTIACRALQADYADETKTVEHVRSKGCQPCILLPFRSVPADCPDDVSTEVDLGGVRSLDTLQIIHRVRDDFAEGNSSCSSVVQGADFVKGDACDLVPVCADPPRGSLSWSATHESQLAVVNSLIILSFADVPDELYEVTYFDGFPGSTDTEEFVAYSGDAIDATRTVRMWPEINSKGKFKSVSEMVTLSECFVSRRPLFRVRVEELWPDTVAGEQAIKELFGSRSLDWWDALPTEEEKKSRTRAHGLVWSGDLSKDDLALRAAGLTEEIDCTWGQEVWCRWKPHRPGYYRLTGAGAWYGTKTDGGRGWIRGYDLQPLERRLQNLSTAKVTDIEKQLKSMGWEKKGLTLKQLGLELVQSGTGKFLRLLPCPAKDCSSPEAKDWLYSTDSGSQSMCIRARQAVDLRVTCGNTRGTANYTETDPIGILVNEVRVSTRAPAS